ncbi:MAG TPA: hypothetical protein PLS71_08375, partial [Leptospiraceae bacterium]|nr:hypothetical protein [Leptospiraceae bacterium]
TKVAEKLKFFKNDILSMILKANYYEYLEKQNANGGRNFFEIKQNHFVKYFSEEKKLEMIHSLVSEEEFKLASLFLLILSPKYSQRLTEIMPNDNETEKRLYLALEDDVFTLAKINPELYFRLLEILKDDSTGMLEILNEYREIANFSLASLERVKMIMDEYETVRDKIFPLQWFYTKLKNTSNEERIQIVRLLEQEEKISKADKDLLESFFSNHSRIFFL